MPEETGTNPSPTGPEPLSGSLAVQPSAVVSRVLLRNKGGNVTLFAFDTGEGLSEHTAPYDALLVGVEGMADVSIEASRFRVAAGEAILLPANRPHAVAAVEPFKMLLVMIRA